MKTGPWAADLVYLENDPMSDETTRLGGGSLDYAVEEFVNLGAGLYSLDSDIASRDGMTIYNLRASVHPFTGQANMEALKPLVFSGEFVYQDRDSDLDEGIGWHLTARYQFEEVPWQPALTYRYASFDENYDSLFYGFSDWGSWYQGEILGEYVLGNANLDAHMVKLSVQPLEPVSVHLLYFHFLLHDAQAFEVATDNYADEWNLVVDWAVNDHLSLSLVGAYAVPDDAAIEHTGGDEDWSYVMLYGSVKF
jgi:hypothetical protein